MKIDPATQTRLEESLARRQRGLVGRERVGQAAFSLAFLLAAGLFALLAPAERAFDPGVAVALVLAYALLCSAEFSTGAGYVVPTQIVVVPMLLLAPTPLAPLLIAAALVLVSGAQAVRGDVAPGRVLLSLGDAWFALAPAAVLVAAGAQTPDWDLLWAYGLALLAQFAADAALSAGRMWLSLGIRPGEMLRELRFTYLIDALLAPLGLVAAFGVAERPALILLVLPLGALFLVFSHEREDRVQRILELNRAYRGTALLLHDVVEESDEYTARHTEDVVDLSVRVADELGLREADRRAVELGALLHDVGKIAIGQHIICKPGPLDESEWAVMRTHTLVGQRMLEQVGGLLGEVGVVVRASHERWDGNGYPDGLGAEEIPLAARVVCACDAFNAMTTDRPYRAARSPYEALSEVRAMAGRQFDPDVCRALDAVVRREGVSWSRRHAPAPA